MSSNEDDRSTQRPNYPLPTNPARILQSQINCSPSYNAAKWTKPAGPSALPATSGQESRATTTSEPTTSRHPATLRKTKSIGSPTSRSSKLILNNEGTVPPVEVRKASRPVGSAGNTRPVAPRDRHRFDVETKPVFDDPKPELAPLRGIEHVAKAQDAS